MNVISPARARAMYAGGRGNAAARFLSRAWVEAFRRGAFPQRGITLEVAGRTTGRLRHFPLIAADQGRDLYLVSMLGEDCNWVRNVRAAQGRVRLWRGRHTRAAVLVEVPVAERAPILKRYLAKAPGGRPHIPVDPHAPVAAFAQVAGRYPVFRVVWE
jgi:deazaflavin-dependent oxidoreductase (nitroreductase family)